MKVMYAGEATATGARHGSAESDDGRLKVDLSAPSSLGGNDGPGTNPEQLFAAAWASCFGGALEYVAQQKGVETGEVVVQAKVGVGPTEKGAFGLVGHLVVTVPKLDQAAAEQLVAEADLACPYSNAVRGNVEVTLVSKGLLE
jgi:lipoyl-dependent peroxiredoxin